jgi:BirA family biotin operon repressor/biotin-[acetyl-CoA-carboxylase] ligase
VNGRVLADRLARESWIERIVVLDSVDSTNDEMRRRAADGARSGSVIVAEHQSAGRGRRGSAWHSPRGAGLYLSVLLRPDATAADATRWTLAAAVAACAACRSLTAATVEIEWPNDLVHAGRKLGGVLTEMRSQGGRATELVLGVGINVLQRPGEFPDELGSVPTSLGIAVGHPVDRCELAARYLEELGGVAARLGQGDWESVAGRWESWAPGGRGRRVRVTLPARGGAVETYCGTTCGLDAQGALSVLRDNGDRESVRMIEAVEPMES